MQALSLAEPMERKGNPPDKNSFAAVSELILPRPSDRLILPFVPVARLELRDAQRRARAERATPVFNWAEQAKRRCSSRQLP